MQRKHLTTLVAAALVELYAASLAQAACPIDGATPIRSGKLNPINGFSETVTDSSGIALQLCTDPTYCAVSPVIAGNAYSEQIGSGVESFFWSAGGKLQGPRVGAVNGVQLVLSMATEAAFLAAEPVNGQQFQFTRLRVVMSTPFAGVYTLVHPYGTETFTVTVPTNSRDATLTFDRGFAPNSTVTGRVGPFLQWDPAVAPAAPTTIRPDGSVQAFLGDGGLAGAAHAVVGSPCGTNYMTLSVQPLAGGAAINLDGAGHNFLTTNQFTVSGMVWDGDYQTPLTVSRLTYSRPDAALGQIGQIDSFATSTSTATVTVQDGPNTPLARSRIATAQPLTSDQLGVFSLSSVLATGPNSADLPATLALTATEPGATPVSDPTTLIAPLVDFVKISRADFDPVANRLTVDAASGDQRVAPTLTVREFNVAPGTPITTAAPPARVTVVSSAGGRDSALVRVLNVAPPTAPSGLSGVANSPTQVSLSWVDNANNETSYLVERDGAVIATLAANAVNHVDTTAPQDSTVTYRVMAANAGGRTASDPIIVTTPVQLNAPTGLRAVGVGSTSVTLGWTDASNNETGFQILRNGVALATIGANSVTYVDNSVAASTTYSYQVVALHPRATSTSAALSVTTAAATAAGIVAPTGLSAVAGSVANSALLRWVDTSNGETGYRIQRAAVAIANNGSVTTAAFNNITSVAGGVVAANSTSAQDSGLTASAVYAYRVNAFSAAGQGPVSASVTFANTPVVAPTNLRSNVRNGGGGTPVGQVPLGWTASTAANVAGYDIELCTGTVNACAAVGATWSPLTSLTGRTAASYTASGLISGQAYAFRIRSKSLGVNSAFSAGVAGTPR